MFVHDNSKISVLANSRCGHQSMYDYFGLPVEAVIRNKIEQWTASPNQKVLVLRNPIERMWSGINLYELYAKPVVNMYDAAKKKGIDKSNYAKQFPFASLFFDEGTRNDTIQQIIFRDHCAPYLSTIEDTNVEYSIIDFERLSEYIPLAARTNITACQNVSLDNFVENEIFTKEDMQREYELYLTMLQSKTVLSPEEWKSLTVVD